MEWNRRTRFFTLTVFVLILITFTLSYNSHVTKIVVDGAYQDKTILKEYNYEIIRKLVAADSTEQWQDIVSSYDEVIVRIEDENNDTVARTFDKKWSVLDVKSQTPFEYKNKAYAITSSVYFLREHVAEDRNLVTFLFIELMIGLSAIAILIFAIYTRMLHPYKKLYRAIEEYDRTGKMKETNIKGYAGKVYGRFLSMTKNLEQQQNNQRRIIASISHDIKTPLTSIMGYTERLKKDSVPMEKKKQYIDTVYGKSVEIQQLVNEFDEYLNLNLTNQIHFETVTTEALAASILNDYYDDLERAGVTLVVENKAKNTCIQIDQLKFKRVCGNLFGNSIKHFSRKEHIIKVVITSEKKKVFIEFHDNGKGVEEEMLEVIFEPLYTSDKGRKVAGLGLSICREIIDRHGGRIYAEKSEELGGLCICVELTKAG